MTKHVDTPEALLWEVGAVPNSYRICMPIRSEDFLIEAREAPPVDGNRVIRWAIVQNGFVWTKRNRFEIEPMPSNRTDAFLKRARYDTLLEALQAAKRAKKHLQARCDEMLKRHARARATEVHHAGS